MNPILIVGAGGHGREINDVIVAINRVSDEPQWLVLGFLDDGMPDDSLLEGIGLRNLGASHTLADYAGVSFVIGVGSGRARARVDDLAKRAGLEAATLVHPSATVGEDTELGAGSVLFSHTSVTTHIRIGRHVHVNRNSTIGHDSVLDDYVTIHPTATISGNVHLAFESTIGAGAVVLPGLSVGARSTIGAGATVVSDIPNNVVAVGLPARVTRATGEQDSAGK